MNEIQLKICDIQGRLFELSAEKKYDSINFIKAFMMSNVAKELDSSYNRMQWAGEEYLLEEVAAAADETLTNNGEIFSADMLYGEDSAKIYKQAPAMTMKRNYMLFHTMDPVLAIEDLKEIYNQKK